MMLAFLGQSNIWMHGFDPPWWFFPALIAILVALLAGCVYILYLYVACLIRQQKILKHGGAVHCGLTPGLVWLQLIPGVNLFMSYVAAWHVAETVRRLGGPSPVTQCSLLKNLGFITGHAGVLFIVNAIVSLVWFEFNDEIPLFFSWCGLGLLWLLILLKYSRRLKETVKMLSEKRSSLDIGSSSSAPALIKHLKEKYRGNERLVWIAFIIGFSLAMFWGTNLVFEPYWWLEIRRNMLVWQGGFFYCSLWWLWLVYKQFQAMHKIGPDHRTISPGYVLLQAIPGLNYLCAYLMSRHVSWSVQVWTNEQGGKPDYQIKDMGTIICHFALITSLSIFLPRYEGFHDFPLGLMLTVAIFWTLLVRQYLRALNAATATT